MSMSLLLAISSKVAAIAFESVVLLYLPNPTNATPSFSEPQFRMKRTA
jgi:hypothetical protein